MKVTFFFLCLLLCQGLWAKAPQYQYRTESNIRAVGDIHGNLKHLLQILLNLDLIDQEGKWKGGGQHLVLMGDLINKSYDSYLVQRYLMDLEKEALDAGGKIHTLLGNHELYLLQGLVRTNERDALAFPFYRRNKKAEKIQEKKKNIQNDDLISEDKRKNMLASVEGNTDLAKWYRSRPTMVSLNQYHFQHAGVSEEMVNKKTGPRQMNKQVMKWVRFFQGMGSKPSKKTRWLIEKDGPLFSRAITKDLIDQKSLEAWLKRHKKEKIFLGHTARAETIFQDFDGLVYFLDTKINLPPPDGKLSSVEISPQGEIKTRHWDKSGDPLFLEAKIRKRYQQDCRLGQLSQALESL